MWWTADRRTTGSAAGGGVSVATDGSRPTRLAARQPGGDGESRMTATPEPNPARRVRRPQRPEAQERSQAHQRRTGGHHRPALERPGKSRRSALQAGAGRGRPYTADHIVAIAHEREADDMQAVT